MARKRCNYCDKMSTKRVITEGNNIPVCYSCLDKAIEDYDKDDLHIINVGKSVTQIKAHEGLPPNYRMIWRGSYKSCDACALFIRESKWCSLYSQDVEPNFVCDSYAAYSLVDIDQMATANIVAVKQLSEDIILELANYKLEDKKQHIDIKIKALDEERHIVSGPVLVPDEMDLQEDITPEAEIENAAYEYLKSYRSIDEMHTREEAEAAVIESVVLKTDLDFYGDGDILAKGTWLMSVEVWGATWDAVKSGNRNGFSIDGTAIGEDI